MTPQTAAVLSRLRTIASQPWPGDALHDTLLRAIVPAFAEWGILDTRGTEPSTDDAVCVYVAHESARDEEAVRRAVENLSPDKRLLDVSLAAFHERRPMVERTRLPAALALAGGTDVSALALPLLSRGRLVGVLTLVRSGEFEPDDVDSGEEFASRCATAIDLAREVARVERTRGSRDEMIGVLAHDLRTPLSTLSMVTSRLKKNRTVVEVAATETQVLSRSVTRIEALLRTLVDCTRLESGKIRLQAEPCELGSVVGAAIEAQRAAAGKRNIVLERPEGATFEVVGDAARLRQVLDQLLTNALKFSAEDATVVVRIAKTPADVTLSVKDDGLGIDADSLEDVFVPSWEIPAEKRASGQGPRIGLYVARGLVEAQGGRLWVESARGEGSTFSFSLPRADASRAQAAILVVDDDAAFRHEVGECLREEGFTVVGAPHGRAALDYLHTHEQPALVLLDLTMPVMDGWELYREIRGDAALAKIPVVVLSGLSRTPAERTMLSDAEYLEKPLRRERLLEVASGYAHPAAPPAPRADA